MPREMFDERPRVVGFEKIAGTRILETWFQGNKVYAAATAPPR